MDTGFCVSKTKKREKHIDNKTVENVSKLFKISVRQAAQHFLKNIFIVLCPNNLISIRTKPKPSMHYVKETTNRAKSLPGQCLERSKLTHTSLTPSDFQELCLLGTRVRETLHPEFPDRRRGRDGPMTYHIPGLFFFCEGYLKTIFKKSSYKCWRVESKNVECCGLSAA